MRTEHSELFAHCFRLLFTGLEVLEVVADDFLIIGSGETTEEGIRNHDKNIVKFLQISRKYSLHLNTEKIQFKKTEINYIGHISTTNGIKVEVKIEAIVKMESPKDSTGVKRIMGMCQYLTKFLPNFSDKTIALRNLTKKRQPWQLTELEEQ